jgi:poly(3-hydroxybutyrate) depolymerase
MSGRFMIDAAGTMREYIIKLPAAYDSTRPYKLIFTFHGRMYSAQTVADGGPPGSGPYYGIEAVSGGTTIFVAPQATSSSWGNANDVPYIEAMIARFKAELCIDESRIFSVGFSAGAIMTLTASCEDNSVFRAIAPMSASLPADCNGNDRARAYWGSHGTEDPTIRINQGEAVRDSFIAKNGCTMTTMPGDRSGCVNYQGCDAGAPVTWCTFSGVHEPPPYAGEAIWAFFSQF